MKASEKSIEGRHIAGQARVSLLIGLFGVVALLFGLLHFADGLSTLVKTLSRTSVVTFQVQFAIIFIDLVFGVASIFIAVGLFLRKNWARKAWLAFLGLMLVVWLHLTLVFSLKLRVLNLFAGYSLGKIWPWIAMLSVVSVASWTYLTKASVKARFR